MLEIWKYSCMILLEAYKIVFQDFKSEKKTQVKLMSE